MSDTVSLALLVPAFVRSILAASVARPKPPGCPQRYNFTLEMIVQAGRKRIAITWAPN